MERWRDCNGRQACDAISPTPNLSISQLIAAFDTQRINAMKTLIAILTLFLAAAPLCAKEELVTLPPRDAVQLTIYNSEDCTLVRETRTLSFTAGENRIQFSWANTLIDPTSVEFQAVDDKDGNVEVADTSYPAESHEMLIWSISAKKAASHKVQISYFTSGITWSAEYTGLVNSDESAMDLTAYVTVHNHSGEDYENAQVRLVVGVIHLVEKIIYLAQPRTAGPAPAPPTENPQDDMKEMEKGERDDANEDGMHAKEIQKGALSEYYIYTVEGRETVPNGWSKRLKSFFVAGVPMKTVYHLEPAKFGPAFTKVLEFKNDEEHKLGKEPLPDGLIRLYKLQNGGMGYMGELWSKYIPKNDEVKVNVGADPEVTLKEKRMSFRKQDLSFENGWLAGWTTVEEFELEVKNFRNKNVEVEIHRSVYGDFDFDSTDNPQIENFNTKKFIFSLNAATARTLKLRVTMRFGSNVKQK